jgi:hypothetical protein
MIANRNVNDEEDIKLKREITEKTGPDTLNNQGNWNSGYKILNSVLNEVNQDKIAQYITIPENEIIKEIPVDKGDINDNKENLFLKANINLTKNKNDKHNFSKRVDRFNTPITKKGKQKVTFIDRITKNKFIEVIKVESFKEYNKWEEVANSHKNNCCVLI